VLMIEAYIHQDNFGFIEVIFLVEHKRKFQFIHFFNFIFCVCVIVIKSNFIEKNRLIPYAGVVTILLNDYPSLKILVIAVLGLYVIVSRE